MENRFKFSLSRMFHSSLSSCRTRNLSDIIETAVFDPQNQRRNLHQSESPPPKTRPFPSICKTGSSQTRQTIISATDLSLPRRRVSSRYSSFIAADGQTCPPASPTSPLKPFTQFGKYGSDEKMKNLEKVKGRTKKKKKTHMKKREKENNLFTFCSSSLDSSFSSTWWYSSEEEDETDAEDETETLFSSKSLSSESSEIHRRRHPRRKSVNDRRNRDSKQSSEMGLVPPKGKVKESFAVVKKSSDPYNDFRTSMLEMIIEKQMFSAKDLEQLLQCFLSLNSSHHHRVIVEVFTEILDALFSDWGS